MHSISRGFPRFLNTSRHFGKAASGGAVTLPFVPWPAHPYHRAAACRRLGDWKDSHQCAALALLGWVKWDEAWCAPMRASCDRYYCVQRSFRGAPAPRTNPNDSQRSQPIFSLLGALQFVRYDAAADVGVAGDCCSDSKGAVSDTFRIFIILFSCLMRFFCF